LGGKENDTKGKGVIGRQQVQQGGEKFGTKKFKRGRVQIKKKGTNKGAKERSEAGTKGNTQGTVGNTQGYKGRTGGNFKQASVS